MATIVLQVAGAALGSVFGPLGAIIGQAAGAMAGNLIDQSILNSGTRRAPHLATARLPGAEEGSAITRAYGTVRLSGTMIWATRFEEDVVVESRSGGKGSGPRTETYRYFANFAVGLCEGEIALVRRVWADGRELDLASVDMRVYTGSATQLPDPLIEAKQGAGRAPAYRGLAYVVFERLALAPYGNRMPVLQFEVVRTVGTLESKVQAVTITPGATEHGYATSQVTEKLDAASTRILNRNILHRRTDWEASIDDLQRVCPALKTVSLVVAWFATDLRAGQCRIVPGVETPRRNGESAFWMVSGKTRATAWLVSRTGGKPSYGGTPDDASVVEAIRDLKARGLEVCLYPFLLVDVPAGNTLPSPYGGASQQPFAWRGKITCFPATGQPGSADRTVAARNQINSFCGSAQAANFSVTGTRVIYTGNEDSYRRFILHYALLARAAGGVSGFILGSELPGLTHLRDQTGAFPFVEKLVTLAADVRAICGPATRLTYAADWSEYFGYQPADGTGEVHFNLDPLWASPNLDAIGIDNYMPLADWRDEDLTRTQPDGMRLSDDPQALQKSITSGEGFDWYYASASARAAGRRSPVTDGLAGKPWVFRFKDIESWWSQKHYNRINGAEAAQPTAWQPRMKPVWFTELGCPAIDKGANQPNMFVDPKSSESGVPWFSNGQRSDTAQRRFLEAHLGWWSGPQAPAGMVDPKKIFLWSWDARPQPAFPENRSLFADGDAWVTGHWLNGRLGCGTLADIIAAILKDHGFTRFNVDQVSGDLPGTVQADVVSARQLLEPLMTAFGIDALDDGGVLTFRSRFRISSPPQVLPVLADDPKAPLWQETRGQDSDYASQCVLDYFDEAGGYNRATARSRRLSGGNDRLSRTTLSGVLPEQAADLAVELQLRDHQMARRQLKLALSPGLIALQPGDVISVPGGPDGAFLVTHIADGEMRQVEARAFSAFTPGFARQPGSKPAAGSGGSSLFAPLVQLMDLPRFEAGAASDFARAAILANPFRLAILSSSPGNEGFVLRTRFERSARIGQLTAPLGPGQSGRFDRSQVLDLSLATGSLSSASRQAVFAGANRLALQSNSGVWEILSFLDAVEVSPGQWRLSGLLRGQAGTEDAMAAGAPSGAYAVVLDAAVKPVGLTASEAGLLLNYLVEAVGSDAPAAGPIAFAGGLRAETPLAPVHAKARRLAGGDVQFTWKRRGREDADSWQGVEIPLDEPAERYRIELMKNASPVRSAEITAPLWTLTSAAELADFGSAQTTFSIRLRQLGSKVADGLPLVTTLRLI